MADLAFSDTTLAALYDVLNPWDPRGDFGFYFPRVMAARSVLDVGCGTGMLLHKAREAGHTGRLCGLDPAEGMLAQARKRADIEWVRGELSSVSWEDEFDLVVMSGHAFQVFVTDEELRVALSAIRSALTGNGRFAFDTRNPLVQGWRRWTPENAVEITDANGAVVKVWHEVEEADGQLVRFSTAFACPAWESPRVSRSTLRFLGTDSLSRLLSEAGLLVEEQFGDWAGGPLTETSPEIITIASARGR